jgi:hypothetical protein
MHLQAEGDDQEEGNDISEAIKAIGISSPYRALIRDIATMTDIRAGLQFLF